MRQGELGLQKLIFAKLTKRRKMALVRLTNREKAMFLNLAFRDKLKFLNRTFRDFALASVFAIWYYIAL